MIAIENEQALPQMLRASIAGTWRPQTSGVLKKKIIHILFFTLKQESLLTTSIVLHLFFFSPHICSCESPWDLVSQRSCKQQVSQSSRIIWIILLKSVDTLIMSVVRHSFKIGLKCVPRLTEIKSGVSNKLSC